jgi:hypothetical protein
VNTGHSFWRGSGSLQPQTRSGVQDGLEATARPRWALITAGLVSAQTCVGWISPGIGRRSLHTGGVQLVCNTPHTNGWGEREVWSSSRYASASRYTGRRSPPCVPLSSSLASPQMQSLSSWATYRARWGGTVQALPLMALNPRVGGSAPTPVPILLCLACTSPWSVRPTHQPRRWGSMQ